MEIERQIEVFRKSGCCASCGAAVGRQCGRCGTFLFASEHFCPSCGVAAGARVQPASKEEYDWSAEELAHFEIDALGADHQSPDDTLNACLDQDDVDELFT